MNLSTLRSLTASAGLEGTHEMKKWCKTIRYSVVRHQNRDRTLSRRIWDVRELMIDEFGIEHVESRVDCFPTRKEAQEVADCMNRTVKLGGPWLRREKMTKRSETIVPKPRIPYGNEKTSWPTGRCHDCGVKRGQLHGVGCDVEECPICGGQLLACTVEGKHD